MAGNSKAALFDPRKAWTPHEYSGYIPEEDVPVIAHSFRNVGWFMVLGQLEQYNRYMATADLEPGYRYHKRVLKLLQWKNPRKQWV